MVNFPHNTKIYYLFTEKHKLQNIFIQILFQSKCVSIVISVFTLLTFQLLGTTYLIEILDT
jgi:hypothetical protein